MRVIILGAGGQARDVAWLIDGISGAGWVARGGIEQMRIVGFVGGGKPGPHDSQTLGGHEWLYAHRSEYDAFAIGIGAPAVRLRVSEEAALAYPDKAWPVLVHPSAIIDRDSATIGRGAAIGAGVVGSVNIRIGAFACVNLGVTVGHETEIGEGAVVNHNASIAGGVRIGRGALIGTNATVLQYLSIGEGATVGAGAVVTHDVPPGETWVGVPARQMKRSA